MITQVTKLNLVPGGVLPRINVTQYDYGSRALEFLIFNGDQRFTLASGMTARIQGTKPDKCGFDYAATVSTANNKITANLTQQMTACHGEVLTELVILKNGENTDNANYYRQQAANSATAAGNQASAAATSATNSTNQALKSEGYAVGTQNGAAVGSTSPYYHKSSKYFSEQASSSASSAAASADRAQSYSVNTPYIGGNGNWFIWDSHAGVYIDSGVDASITVRIADITMLDPTESPYVTNTGTATDPIFHLFLPRGKGVTQIVKTGTVGLQDTYRIDYSDGATSTFVVTNGKGINTITKTSTSGLVDTYTITYNVGSPTTFTVTNGKTAYQSAVEGGYTGTEAEFEEDLASFELWAQTASAAATNAEGSATEAAQSAADAANSAELARVYADFIEPHFIIQNNRLYIKDDAVGEFILENNRLYMKLVS